MSANPRLAIFDTWARRYDQSVHTDRGIFAAYDDVLNAIVEVAALKPSLRVLELGVGTGNLARRLVALGCDVWGTDFSPAMLAIARDKVPEATLLRMNLTAEWPAALRQRFDRVVATFVLHEFPLSTKIELLQRLFAEYLTDEGFVVIGDIAFATADARRQSGAESWDEDEYYWAADETAAACVGTGLEIAFRPISWCTGIFVTTRKLAAMEKKG